MFSLEELDIDFYSSSNCGYCKKAKQILEKDNNIKKLNIKEDIPLPKGVYGVPHFYSNKLNKSHTGCPKSADELVDILNNGKETKNYEYFEDESNSSYLNTNQIIGISIGSAVLGLIIFYFGFRYFKNK